jgi:hypothetical protein
MRTYAHAGSPIPAAVDAALVATSTSAAAATDTVIDASTSVAKDAALVAASSTTSGDSLLFKSLSVVFFIDLLTADKLGSCLLIRNILSVSYVLLLQKIDPPIFKHQS